MSPQSLLLALPLCLLSAGEALEYKATTETRIRVSFEQQAELVLLDQSVTILVDGEEHPAGEAPDIDVTMTMNETTVFVDTYTAVDEDSKPTSIERHYEALSGGYEQEIDGLPDGAEAPEPIEVASELEGEVSLFEWDAEEGEWLASAPEDAEYDEELIEELEQNADLTYLLPESEISTGDSWDLDAEAFRQLLNLGGDLSMEPVDADDDEEEEDELDEDWSSELFRLTLTEVTGDTATIKIELDITRHEEGEIEPPPMPEEMEMDPPVITEIEDIQWAAEGELVWSLTDNRAVSLQLEGTLARDAGSTQEMDGPMGSVSIEQSQTFEGTFTISISFEEAAGEDD